MENFLDDMAKDSDAYEFCEDYFVNDNSTAHCDCFENWSELDLSDESYGCTVEVDGDVLTARDWIDKTADDCAEGDRRRIVIDTSSEEDDEDSKQRPCDEHIWDDWLEDLRESDKQGITLDAEELCSAFLDGTGKFEDGRCACFEEWVLVDLTRDLYACKLLGVMDLTGKEFVESQANVC